MRLGDNSDGRCEKPPSQVAKPPQFSQTLAANSCDTDFQVITMPFNKSCASSAPSTVGKDLLYSLL
jgi:hypothetical protein